MPYGDTCPYASSGTCYARTGTDCVWHLPTCSLYHAALVVLVCVSAYARYGTDAARMRLRPLWY
eukprot:3436253-Rhodomonas_salina.3